MHVANVLHFAIVVNVALIVHVTTGVYLAIVVNVAIFEHFEIVVHVAMHVHRTIAHMQTQNVNTAGVNGGYKPSKPYHLRLLLIIII